MERLTERCALERWTSRETVEPEKFVMVRGKALGRAYFESDKDYKNYCDALEKLAAYEDTGLTPEEIEDALSRFSELLCYLTNNHMSKTNYTMGAMLSEIEDVRQEACERYCDLKQAEQEGRLIVLPCKVGATVWSSVLTKIDDDGTEHAAPWPFSLAMIDEWGKGFFLTREEAEAALKGASDDA